MLFLNVKLKNHIIDIGEKDEEEIKYFICNNWIISNDVWV